MSYCTLFNSNYLDKGIVMISSLKKVAPAARIYVLCMDEQCKRILDDYYSGTIVTIDLGSFEDDELLQVKPHRSKGEYCWTCTAKLIKLVMCQYHEAICTYVDSDLYFYSDPQVLVDEMRIKNCSVQVVAHNFNRTRRGKRLEAQSGKNCVQFNTFANTEESMRLLDWWSDQCIAECSVEKGGDQGYISDWGEKPFVNISANGGAGVAPWNVDRFALLKDGRIRDKGNCQTYDLVFYHFQEVINHDRYMVTVEPYYNYWRVDKKLLHHLYDNYLKKIEMVKREIEERYNYLPLVQVYISNKNSDYSMLKRIVESLHLPLGQILEKINYRLRVFLRKKEAVVDVRLL